MGFPARLSHYMTGNGPLILDGGLATELEAQGANLQVNLGYLFCMGFLLKFSVPST